MKINLIVVVGVALLIGGSTLAAMVTKDNFHGFKVQVGQVLNIEADMQETHGDAIQKAFLSGKRVGFKKGRDSCE